MADPTKEIGQNVIDAIVTEWDERSAGMRGMHGGMVWSAVSWHLWR